MLKIALLPQIDEARQKMSNSLKSQFLDSVQEKKYETLRLIKERPLKAPTLIVCNYSGRHHLDATNKMILYPLPHKSI